MPLPMPNIRHFASDLRSMACIFMAFLLTGCETTAPSVTQNTSQQAPIAEVTPPLRDDLSNLWDGRWLEEVTPAHSAHSALLQELESHRDAFSKKPRPAREIQLAQMRGARDLFGSGPMPPDSHMRTLLQDTFARIQTEYTQLHEDLFQTDLARTEQLRRIQIEPRGTNLRSGAFLAELVDYTVRNYGQETPGEQQRRIQQILNQRLEDYIFSFNNARFETRSEIFGDWQNVPVELLNASDHQLGNPQASRYNTLLPVMQERLAQVQNDIEEGFNRPVFTRRQSLSPAVNEILEMLSENYLEFNTLTVWFEENREQINDALLVMSFRDNPYRIVRLDPKTLEPTDQVVLELDEDMREDIIEMRLQLLDKYFATQERLRQDILRDVAEKRNALSQKERAMLREEYVRMQRLESLIEETDDV